MADEPLEFDPVDLVAEEFLERYRGGERPSVEEFARRHPDLADEIRDLLPTIAAMERIKDAHADRAPSPKLKRLGDYRIVGEIGRGGMGIVYEAIQESLHRRVAVKVLPQSSLLDERRLKRFEREARTAAKLHHTNIVPVLGVGDQDGVHYYVMQYIRGVGLDEVMSAFLSTESGERIANNSPRSSIASDVARALLDGQFLEDESLHDLTVMPNDESERKSTSDKVSEKVDETVVAGVSVSRPGSTPSLGNDVPDGESTDLPHAISRDLFGSNYWRSVGNLGRQVADALHYAHSMGVLHRDVKPANLLLDRSGVVWIADFGLAKAMEHDNVSRTGDIVGTLRYMAPEQLRNEADARSDIFSLGVTLYELVTLRPAFSDLERKQTYISQSLEWAPTAPRKENRRIPKDLETIILKAMAVEPAQRYQDASEMVEDLQRFIDDRPITARRVPLNERVWRWCRRNPAIAALSVIASLLLLIAASSLGVAYVQASKSVIREAALRTQTEETLGDTLAGLDEVYRQFAPDRSWDSVGLSYETEDGESFELEVDPALDERTVAVLMKVLEVYDRLSEKNSDNERLAESAADAVRRVGDIQRRLGQKEEAAESYAKAIRRFKQLAAAAPTPREYQLEVARTHNRLAVMYTSRRDREKRMEVHQQAVETLRELNAKYQDFAAAKFELAKTYYLMGRKRSIDWQPFQGFSSVGRTFGTGEFGGGPGMGPTGRFPGSFGGPPFDLVRQGPDEYRGGRSGVNPRLRLGDRGQNSEQKHLATALRWLDEMDREGNGTDDSTYLRALCLRDTASGFLDKSRAEAIEILRGLVESNPENFEYRLELSETLAQIPPWEGMQQDKTKVTQQLLEARDLAKQLVDARPNVPEYAGAYARRELRLARAFEGQYYQNLKPNEPGDETLAAAVESSYRAAANVQRRTAAAFPSVVAFRFWTLEMEGSLARWLAQMDRPRQAITVFERAIKDVGVIEEFDDESRPLVDALIRLLSWLGHTYARTGDQTSADFAADVGRELGMRFRGGDPFGGPRGWDGQRGEGGDPRGRRAGGGNRGGGANRGRGRPGPAPPRS